jgi:hypothetical protein
MKASVYIETSIVSYLTARLSRDLILAGHQQITEEWWITQRGKYDLYASQLVLREAAEGDTNAAERRLHVLETLSLLAITSEATTLAEQLLAAHSLPAKAAEDALHIAVATVNGMEFLLTWNCKHIANAVMRHKIEQTCRQQGYEPPIIATPEEMLGE